MTRVTMKKKSRRLKKKRKSLDGALLPTTSNNFSMRLAASPKSSLKIKKLERPLLLKLELNS
jgi:hypothetical protein